jgi:hypothetical protein
VFSALLDTCVLVRAVPATYSSKSLAQAPIGRSGVLRSSPNSRTLRTLLGKRGAAPEETDAYLIRLFRQMETAFPDVRVKGWEPLVGVIELPDPDDRHVVAAAIAGRADVLVTDNLADFPPDALPAPLAKQSLDDFLLDSLDLHPELITRALRAIAARTGRSGQK